MRIVFNSDINPKVDKLSKIINSKNTLPILDSFLINVSAKKKTMDISGADIENRITMSFDIVSAEEDFSFCVNAKDFVRVLKGSVGEISLEANPETFALKFEHFSGFMELIGQHPQDYPESKKPNEKENIKFSIDYEVLVLAYSKTGPFVAKDELRPVMNNVYFNMMEDKMDFVASDGHMLSKFTIPNTFGVTGIGFLQKKIFETFVEMVDKSEKIEIIVDSARFFLRSGKTRGFGRLTEGRYPNYNSVIPVFENPQSHKVHRKTLISSIERIKAFANPNSELGKFSFDDRFLTISVQNIDFGSAAEDKVPCQSDEKFQVGLKLPFFERLLKSIESDEVSINTSGDPSRAITITGDNEEEFFLLMPMMLND